jgi:ketosteroid isomerase-like protein
MDAQMSPKDLMAIYESKINLHIFDEVAPLIAADAVFWFNDGSYVGLAAIRNAFEKTWKNLPQETYWLENLQWLALGDAAASCVYHFNWSAVRHDKIISGGGRGTTVLKKDALTWKITHEHLSGFPA